MIGWKVIPSERSRLLSPVGLRLIDDFTGRPPIGSVLADLEIGDGAGGWKKTEIKVKRSAGGVLIYPGLERRSEVVGIPPRLYRVIIRAEFYRPLYLMNADGFEFEAFPYNDSNAPRDYRLNPSVEIKPVAQELRLAPAVNYPMPSNVRVLRGVVVNTAGSPVANVEVSQGMTEKTLTDERGAFGLPLRWSLEGVSIPIDALDHRTLATGTKSIMLPQDLGSSLKITIT